MKVSVISQLGKEVKKIDLDKDIFEKEPSQQVISQYIFAYTSNQREGNAEVKDRSEVSGGGRKPWAQKGTGRARFGSSRNPIWRKGGKAFGATNNVNWKKLLNKKFKLAALSHILSNQLKAEKITFVDDINIDADSKLTKKAVEIKEALGGDSKKITIVTGDKKELVIKAFSNVNNAKVIFSKDLNAYDIYTGGKILIEESALEEITNRFKK